MFAAFGILLLMVGAALVFAVEREAEGVDLQVVGWILMAGGGASLIVALVRMATLGTITQPDRTVPPDRTVGPTRADNRTQAAVLAQRYDLAPPPERIDRMRTGRARPLVGSASSTSTRSS